jgi:hypothetical protein
MVSFIARVKNMGQKFSFDKDDMPRTTVNLTLEIKDGHEDINKLAEILNSPLEFDVKPIQPGLIKP